MKRISLIIKDNENYSSSVEILVMMSCCLDDQSTKFEFKYIKYHDIDFIFKVLPEKSESEYHSRFQVSVFKDLKIIPIFEVFLTKFGKIRRSLSFFI